VVGPGKGAEQIHYFIIFDLDELLVTGTDEVQCVPVHMAISGFGDVRSR